MRLSYERLVGGKGGGSARNLVRDAELYVMHNWMRRGGRTLEDAIEEIVWEWSRRHPKERSLDTRKGRERVRKAIERFGPRLQEALRQREILARGDFGAADK